MKKVKINLLLLALVVAGLSSSSVISSLMNSVTIGNVGMISARTRACYSSEIRGVFIHGINYGGNSMVADWEVIADTLAPYGITDIFVDLGGLPEGSFRAAMLPEVLQAFHSRGFRVHVSWNFLIGGRTEPEDMRAVKYDGTIVSWGCPTKNATREFIKDVVQTIASYDIDGFMFDYIRYVTAEICYCNECRAAFQQWLGEEITDWSAFYPDGERYLEYLEWRNEPITMLVRDVRKWMLEINPDLEFSAAVFALGDDCPIYWRKFIGQDVGNWIRNDYLDFVCPMHYTNDPAEMQMRIRDEQKYWTAGAEGKLPLVIFITNGITTQYSIEDFTKIVNAVRENGADGWIIWRYGGPGNNPSDNRWDIRPYLEAIDMPQTFAISGLRVETTNTSATITWFTDLPTTSIVEYNTKILFNASWEIWNDFHYWNITRIQPLVVENSLNVTQHMITINNLAPRTRYYFRVQSKGESGIATTKVLTFITKG